MNKERDDVASKLAMNYISKNKTLRELLVQVFVLGAVQTVLIIAVLVLIVVALTQH